MMNKQKASKRYYYIKQLLNNDLDIKEYAGEGFYFNSKALAYARKLMKPFHMNPYYDLNLVDLLCNIMEYKSLKEYKKALYMDYKAYYADSIYENMLYLLGA